MTRVLQWLLLLMVMAGRPSWAAPEAPTTNLPALVATALQRAGIPEDSLGVVVQEVGATRPLLSWRAQQAVNPASVIKLLTTFAALDLLGPAFTWSTPVYVQGPLRDGVLDGQVFLKGSGDPRFVIERVWLMLRRLQQLGVREIRGDFVLDRSAFAPSEGQAGDFDADPSRPYNVRADALLLNYKTITYTFLPDPTRGVATVVADPDFSATRGERKTVPLASGPCEDWRGALRAQATDGGYRFTGVFPGSCGEQQWPLADPEPDTYNLRLIELLWRELGGRLGGRVREGIVPPGLRPLFEVRSEALSETIRAINKYSNNVMAQQLFLTLAMQLQASAPARPETAREVILRWTQDRLGEPPPGWFIDNGSGLSRRTRVTPQWVAHLLQQAWASPAMPELLSSLPVSGLDGTLQRARGGAGRAHLKTGTLRDVAGIAGVVLSQGGRRYVVVALVNHAQAPASRPALDALVQWVLRESSPASPGRSPSRPGG